VITIGLRSTFGRSIESVCNQIKKSPSDVLRKNVCCTGGRIEGLLELDIKTLRLRPRSMPCEAKTFLNERIDINRPVLTRPFSPVLHHVLDSGLRPSPIIYDL